MKLSSLAVLGPLLLAGCVSLNTVSLTSVPSQRDHPVEAKASKFVFLGLNFNNDFVNDMDEQLRSKCPDGVISGILTKDEIVDYFLMIFWTHRVTATGYCNKSRVATGAPSRDRRPSAVEETSQDGEQ